MRERERERERDMREREREIEPDRLNELSMHAARDASELLVGVSRGVALAACASLCYAHMFGCPAPSDTKLLRKYFLSNIFCNLKSLGNKDFLRNCV